VLRHLERPSAGEAVGALVFLHGKWGIPEDFVPFLDDLDPDRRFHGYLPQGPTHMSEGRYEWDGGEALVAEWFDGLPYEPARIVVAGWSQGTRHGYGLALGAGRPRLAGMVALGGWMPDDVDLTGPLPPVAIAHGTEDASVPVAAARLARDRLEAAGAQVLYRETAIGHEIDHAVVPDLQRFLAALP
jgi:phospholipase/carboxylesterase